MLGAIQFEFLGDRLRFRGGSGDHGLVVEGGLSQQDDLGVVLAQLAVSLSPGVPADTGARKGQLVAPDDADHHVIVVGRRCVVGEVVEAQLIQAGRQRHAVVGLEHDGRAFRVGMLGVAVQLERRTQRAGFRRVVQLADPSLFVATAAAAHRGFAFAFEAAVRLGPGSAGGAAGGDNL